MSHVVSQNVTPTSGNAQRAPCALIFYASAELCYAPTQVTEAEHRLPTPVIRPVSVVRASGPTRPLSVVATSRYAWPLLALRSRPGKSENDS